MFVAPIIRELRSVQPFPFADPYSEKKAGQLSTGRSIEETY